MATSSVEQDGPDRRAALLAERFGEVQPLAAERFSARQHGLRAPLCTRCHLEHDQAVAAGRWPPPVQPTAPGSDRCGRHGDGGSDG